MIFALFLVILTLADTSLHFYISTNPRTCFVQNKKGACGMPPRPREKLLRYNTIQDTRPNTIEMPCCVGWAPFFAILEGSQGAVCLAGKSSLHPVGVFCTHLEPPKSHICKKFVVLQFIY